MSSLLIKGGQLFDPASGLQAEGDLYIADGKIVAINHAGSNNPAPFSADQTLNASGLLVCPGLVDLNVFLPEPGFEQKGTVASETRAAAAGGVTSLCCMPNTSPVIDSTSVANLVEDLAKQQGHAKVYPVGALTQGLEGEQLSEMNALKSAGCVALSQGASGFRDNRILLRCMEYAATFDITLFLRPVDVSLARNGCAHEGPVATALGLPTIPESAETVALSRDLLLVEQTGARVHFSQLSCARSVSLIKEAKERGLPVTADVSIHNLMWTEANLKGFNSLYHLQPPLRSEADRAALLQGVEDGTIDAIVSEHRPHEPAAKMAPFPSTAPGMASVQTLLSMTLSLVKEELLSFEAALSRLTFGPAEAASLPAGRLDTGSAADICIIDPNCEWLADEAHWYSDGKNSPLFGQQLTGEVKYTLVDGELVR